MFEQLFVVLTTVCGERTNEHELGSKNQARLSERYVNEELVAGGRQSREEERRRAEESKANMED